MPAAFVFDFTGTLFHIESAASALLHALGPDNVSWAPELERFGAINGSGTSDELPEHLYAAWVRRDLDKQAHRAAYSGLSEHAGLTRAQADAVYERGVSAEAWHPYPDTIRTLRLLHEARTPVALLSNIGWDPRAVLRRYDVDEYFDVLTLSDERGVQKPDPAIFGLACAELGVAPHEATMIGDNPDNDGAAVAIGMGFVLVEPDPSRRRADELQRATQPAH